MGTLLTLRDMESAAQLGQELEVARRLAAIGKLTAGVGHEVKNPINAMVVHLELLRGKLAPGGTEAFAGAQRHVDILAGEMQRLDRVVQTLADFSRPMELHLREHDLRQVVGVVMELTAAEMEENGVQVTVEAPHEPMMVRVDAELMQQALLNLLLNGMQAMPGGGAMRVRMRREQQFAVVEVIDEGEGIPAELLPRIFELYFTTKPKGSGIGLGDDVPNSAVAWRSDGCAIQCGGKFTGARDSVYVPVADCGWSWSRGTEGCGSRCGPERDRGASLNGTNDITRRLASAMLCFGLTVGLGGCRHKAQVATLPPVLDAGRA